VATPEKTAASEAPPATPAADLEVPRPVRGISPRFVGTPAGKTGSVTRIAEAPGASAATGPTQAEPSPSPGLQLFEDEGGLPAPTHPPNAAARRPTATPAHAHPPAHTAPTSASGSPASGGFWVQALSASSSTEAKTRRDRLAARGYPATVVAAEAPNGTHVYRVRVGPYKTREDADRAAAKLQANEKLHPWVVPPGK
jgi:DedD protein